jgi:O-acetyl-ADP-ribose deacetylase (regulator of RNase III)
MTIDLTAVQDDITTVPADVIVNAANKWMRGGGGVDGAIHRAAGPGLLEELERRCPDSNCPTGEVVWTHARRLPAKYVFHAVGPDYRQEDQRDPELLTSCYRNAIDLADQAGMASVNFPLISSGIFAWPREEAVTLAVDAIRSASKWTTFVETVKIVCFSREDRDLVQRILEDHVTVVSSWATVRSPGQTGPGATKAREGEM